MIGSLTEKECEEGKAVMNEAASRGFMGALQERSGKQSQWNGAACACLHKRGLCVADPVTQKAPSAGEHNS
jgi:hypothetical protein